MEAPFICACIHLQSPQLLSLGLSLFWKLLVCYLHPPRQEQVKTQHWCHWYVLINQAEHLSLILPLLAAVAHTIPEEWKSIRNNAVDDLMRTQEARMYLIQYVFYSNSWNWDTMFIGYLFECLQQNLKLTPSPPSIHHLSFLL